MARFPRRARLSKPQDYSEAFASRKRVRESLFEAVINPATGRSARLGLAISKKAAPRAVDRNRLKRMIRETFRERAASLPGVDVVVLARPGSVTADRASLQAALARLWQAIGDRCARS